MLQVPLDHNIRQAKKRVQKKKEVFPTTSRPHYHQCGHDGDSLDGDFVGFYHATLCWGMGLAFHYRFFGIPGTNIFDPEIGG